MARATGPHCSDLTTCPDAMGEGGSGVSFLWEPVRLRLLTASTLHPRPAAAQKAIRAERFPFGPSMTARNRSKKPPELAASVFRHNLGGNLHVTIDVVDPHTQKSATFKSLILVP